MDRIDLRTLPDNIRRALAELDLELSEGDITQKGYDKKRQRLLAPYVPTAEPSPTPPPLAAAAPEPSAAQQVPPNCPYVYVRKCFCL